jgi:hypothetical protein
MESASKKCASGNKMDNGIPGNHPPVPASKIRVPGLKVITLAIDKECKMW